MVPSRTPGCGRMCLNAFPRRTKPLERPGSLMPRKDVFRGTGDPGCERKCLCTTHVVFSSAWLARNVLKAANAASRAVRMVHDWLRIVFTQSDSRRRQHRRRALPMAPGYSHSAAPTVRVPSVGHTGLRHQTFVPATRVKTRGNTAKHPLRSPRSIASRACCSPDPHRPACPKTTPRPASRAAGDASPERADDHAHAIVHPACRPQLPHSGIDDRIAGLASLPGAQLRTVRILRPGKAVELHS